MGVLLKIGMIGMTAIRTIVVVALVAGSQALGVSARADDTSARRGAADERWIPGASLYSMGLVDERAARVSDDSLGTQQGDSLGVLWSVGVSLELASPVILDVPGKPRLYLHGDVGFAYDTEDPVASAGDPGARPSLIGGTQGAPSVQAFENVGSAARVQAEPLVLSGGVGAVLELDFWSRRWRLRPSLEWIYRRDEVNAVVGAVEVEQPGGGPNRCGPCRILFFESQTEKGYHSLGPGLEIETDAGRYRDILMSVYASGRAYRILGDRRADFDSSGSWERTDGLPTSRPDTVLSVRYEREPWHYRFGVGLRFMWSPE